MVTDFVTLCIFQMIYLKGTYVKEWKPNVESTDIQTWLKIDALYA